jgi:two-component system, NarL family, sensor kinase
VSLYSDKNKVYLDITDDGVGFDMDKVSKRKGKLKIGIQGMIERVESLGGEFSIMSEPKRGTQLKAALPL